MRQNLTFNTRQGATPYEEKDKSHQQQVATLSVNIIIGERNRKAMEPFSDRPSPVNGNWSLVTFLWCELLNNTLLF